MDKETQKKATTALARLIVDAKLPFNMVTNKAFRDFIQTLNKHVPSISRRTIVREIENEFKERMPMIKECIRKVDSNITLTCDVWSSRTLRGYFVVTAHWIDDNFELQNVVLDFVHFPPPHDQSSTKSLLLKIIHDFQIE